MGDPRTVELEPVAATIESFAPYGVLPPDEGDGNPTADLDVAKRVVALIEPSVQRVGVG